ncbi:MAG: hemerythrin domain-containing protein [Gammaproteobacteria bacterium]|nr:hemerythrin domain-containing protein [Gammaproteobacteria bacterium]
MDIFEHARSHHRRAVDLLDELRSSHDPSRCRDGFSRLQDELRAHEQVETDLLYPVLRERAHMPMEIGGLLSEHTRIKALCARIAAAQPCGEQWREAVEALASSLGRHVADEEEGVFPRARDLVDDATLNEISAAADHAAADSGSRKESVKDRSQDAASAVRQPAREVGAGVGRMREDAERRFVSLLSEQGRMVAGQGHEFAAALRETGENLQRREVAGGLAGYVVGAADDIDEWMKRLEHEDPRHLLSMLDDAARRNPTLVFGGALGVGFLLSRFMRSSGERADASDVQSPGEWGAEYERVDQNIGMEAGMRDFGSEP